MVLDLSEIQANNLQNLPGFKWPDICISGRWWHVLKVSPPDGAGFSKVNVCPLGGVVTYAVHSLPYAWIVKPHGRILTNGYWYTFNPKAVK